MTQDELMENFSYLTDWEDKYRYLIELGESLPLFDEADKTPQNKVEGCMSQVWFTHKIENNLHIFNATSDAHIVRGLEAVLLTLVNKKTSAQIQETDIPAVFEQLGLQEHLSPTRRNGFFAMIERVKKLAS